jgi:hypothetical protein
MRREGRKMFLDSGAFSAYTKGVDIDLPAYCEFIKANLDIIENVDGCLLASVLDGIGDPQKTWENQQRMERLGVKPLPCFHFGEDPRYLDYYAANYEYITIGGMVPIQKPQLFTWLDRIWEKHLCDGAGRPKVRVHGFGLTRIDMMRRYPWFSVDSSSWVQVARVGGMQLLDGGMVSVSEEAPSRKQFDRHIDTMSKEHRAALEKQLVEAGTDLVRMRTTYLARWAYNIWAFEMIGRDQKKQNDVFKFDQIGLF